MGQSDAQPGARDTQKVPAEQRDQVTTDHTQQNPAQAPGESKAPQNTAEVRATETVGTEANREAGKAEVGKDSSAANTSGRVGNIDTGSGRPKQ